MDYLWAIIWNPKQDEGNENKNNPHLIIQFIDVLIQYWKSGEGLFFLAEGGTVYYQFDLFLEKTNFKNYSKVKFKIEGEGGGNLIGSKDNILKKDILVEMKNILN